MKKALIVIGVFFAVVVAAAVIFISTFNADHYRPQVIEFIEKQTGKKASLDKIYLGFKNGITLNVRGIELRNQESDAEPAVRVGQISANVRLIPLLSKQVQMTQISIKEPSIEIIKSLQGKINAGGFEADSSKSNASSSASASKPASAFTPELSIENIQVRDGKIHYRDLSVKPTTDITVNMIDVDVKNFSLTKPFEVLAKASAYSKEQNLYANAIVTLPSADRPGQAESIVIQSDLSKLAYPAPALKKISGVLQLTSQKIIFGNMDFKLDLLLKNANIAIEGLPSDLTQIDLQATYQNDNVTIASLSAVFAEAPIRVRGNIAKITSSQELNFQASLKDLDINRLAKIANSNAPRLSGKLSIDAEGAARGLVWPSISQSLNARGQLALKEGVILNYNVLREVMQKLGAIPGVQESLSANFPQSYAAAINQNSTLLKPVLLSFVVQNGAVNINPVNIDSDFVSIFGALSYRLDNFLSLDALLRLNRELSSALAQAAPMINPVLNAQGLVEVPFTAQGVPPQLKISADVKSITSKIVSAKAGEVVSEILKDPAGAKKNIRGILERVSGAGSSPASGAGETR